MIQPPSGAQPTKFPPVVKQSKGDCKHRGTVPHLDKRELGGLIIGLGFLLDDFGKRSAE